MNNPGYELLKLRSELELHQAIRRLLEIDAEIVTLGNEISSLAATLGGTAAAGLSTAGWIACYRRSECLTKQMEAARVRRQEHTAILAQMQETRKRWAIAEESMVSLRRSVDEANRAEAAKAQQLQLDETVLRQWLGMDEADSSRRTFS